MISTRYLEVASELNEEEHVYVLRVLDSLEKRKHSFAKPWPDEEFMENWMKNSFCWSFYTRTQSQWDILNFNENCGTIQQNLFGLQPVVSMNLNEIGSAITNEKVLK
jgi:uncharacterized protein (DUF608 family)